MRWLLTCLAIMAVGLVMAAVVGSAPAFFLGVLVTLAVLSYVRGDRWG